jgi:hypothetical protein
MPTAGNVSKTANASNCKRIGNKANRDMGVSHKSKLPAGYN